MENRVSLRTYKNPKTNQFAVVTIYKRKYSLMCDEMTATFTDLKDFVPMLRKLGYTESGKNSAGLTLE